jgi:hypothetical protein
MNNPGKVLPLKVKVRFIGYVEGRTPRCDGFDS